MAFKIFRKITSGVATQHWTVDDPDWNKYYQEDNMLNERQHSMTEQQIINEGASEISQQDWSDYLDYIDSLSRIGGHPPSKP